MKYKLTDKTITYWGRTLHRIQALKDFGDVKAGDIGGWIESERNLSQDGDCWVADDAQVFGDALVFDNARISDNALVYEDARVLGNAQISGTTWITGRAWVSDRAEFKNGYITCYS